MSRNKGDSLISDEDIPMDCRRYKNVVVRIYLSIYMNMVNGLIYVNLPVFIGTSNGC